MKTKTKYQSYKMRTYQISTYDVWGNSKDGWEVNNVFSYRTVRIKCHAKVYNEGTPQEFVSYDPTDLQLNRALQLTGAAWEGDGENLYANNKRSGKPLCELHLIEEE